MYSWTYFPFSNNYQSNLLISFIFEWMFSLEINLHIQLTACVLNTLNDSFNWLVYWLYSMCMLLVCSLRIFWKSITNFNWPFSVALFPHFSRAGKHDYIPVKIKYPLKDFIFPSSIHSISFSTYYLKFT